MNEDFRELSMAEFEGGVIEELLQRELSKVLDNIDDDNTKPDARREINLKVVFLPNSDRDAMAVDVQATSKLQPVRPFGSRALLGRKNGKLRAVEHTMKQAPLFDEESSGSNLRAVKG